MSGELKCESIHFRGMQVMVGRDDDGDLFVNVNTEGGWERVNNDEGDPQVYVYLNDATLHDPEEFAVEKERMLQEQDIAAQE
jgi:hypothetical protein